MNSYYYSSTVSQISIHLHATLHTDALLVPEIWGECIAIDHTLQMKFPVPRLRVASLLWILGL